MIPYKHSNGRLMARQPNGKFRNFTLKDFGLNANTDYMICGKCGYGENDKWIPLLKDGCCPNCDNQEGHKEKVILLSDKAEKIIQEIEELESKIKVNGFIHPMMLNQFGGDLRRLEHDLEVELRKCADEMFDKD